MSKMKSEWSKKMDQLRKRPLARVDVRLGDDDAAEAVNAARTKLNQVSREVRRELNAARIEADSEIPVADEQVEADERVQAAHKAVSDAVAAQGEADVVVRLQALPADVWEELVNQHQPTPKQRDLGQTYDITTFAPACIAACHMDGMSVEEAAALVGGRYPELDDDGQPTGELVEVSALLSQGEAATLFNSAVTINQNARVSLGKG